MLVALAEIGGFCHDILTPALYQSEVASARSQFVDRPRFSRGHIHQVVRHQEGNIQFHTAFPLK